MDNGSLETVSLGDYVGVVWRRKWIALLVTVMITAAAVLYARHQQTLYAATSKVIYNPQGVSSTPASSKGAPAAGSWASSMIDQATSGKYASAVIAKAGLADKSPADLLSRTTVTASPNGNALLFTVSDPSPRQAVRLADAFARNFAKFIVPPQTHGKLYNAKQQLAQLKLETKTPHLKYGPWVLKSDGSPVIPLQVDTTTLSELPTLITLKEQRIHQLEQQQPTPAEVTFTKFANASSATQTQPQVTKTALIGLFAGLVLAVFLAFLQDVLDTRIRSAEDIGRRLRVPLLARVPQVPRQIGRQLAMLAPASPLLVASSEAYRIAKLNLSGILERTGARAIMFTSAADDEGTSQTVANLAVVLARSGKHVILVDANMRQPAQAGFFGLDNRQGLSDVLSGHGRLADTLTAVDVSRPRDDIDPSINGHVQTDGILEVLPAGSPAADPAELLDTRTAGDLLAALRQRGDIVLVDAPAILPVTDAMVLASKVDAVVVISRARRASRPSVVALRRALDNCPAPALGFVFTADSSGRRNDYGGSYTSGRPYLPADDERAREVGVL